jgi:hypothetical protein
MFVRPGEGELGSFGDDPNLPCTKCHTFLHSGGKASCPFRGMGDVQAKKAGARALMQLASPGNLIPPDTPADKIKEKK